jgi:hypothetical protein
MKAHRNAYGERMTEAQEQQLDLQKNYAFLSTVVETPAF